MVAAAAARRGDDLEGVERVAGRALDRTRSMGVALAPCTLPAVGKPNFEVAPGQMEVGMGIHGEPGVGSGPLLPANAVVDDLMDRILEDLQPQAGARVAVLVNGLGATPPEELYILYRHAHRRLAAAGLTIARAWVGEYATSMEMAGASVSVLELDAELEALLTSASQLIRT
jgi:dihydroxyacetone kinase